MTAKPGTPNAVKLSRSLSEVEAIVQASAPLSQRFILPVGAYLNDIAGTPFDLLPSFQQNSQLPGLH